MRREVWAGLAAALILAGCGAREEGAVMSGGASSVVGDAARAAEARMGDDGPAAFDVHVELVDGYGNETTEPALRFAWTEATRRRFNRSTIDGYQVIDLADVEVLGRRGVMALAEWCGGDGGRVLTPRLCRLERVRAEDAWAASQAAKARSGG